MLLGLQQKNLENCFADIFVKLSVYHLYRATSGFVCIFELVTGPYGGLLTPQNPVFNLLLLSRCTVELSYKVHYLSCCYCLFLVTRYCKVMDCVPVFVGVEEQLHWCSFIDILQFVIFNAFTYLWIFFFYSFTIDDCNYLIKHGRQDIQNNKLESGMHVEWRLTVALIEVLKLLLIKMCHHPLIEVSLIMVTVINLPKTKISHES